MLDLQQGSLKLLKHGHVHIAVLFDEVREQEQGPF
jgi:hypothetical protein